jgi:hypothetical protein
MLVPPVTVGSAYLRMENDPTWLCSFVSICHVLELDPGYLRAGLHRWRTTTLASEQRQAA